jgi:hypothetical protein
MTHFKVPYANTTNYYEGETGNYFFINEKYYPTQQLLTPPGKKPALNETALRQVVSSTKDITCPPPGQCCQLLAEVSAIPAENSAAEKKFEPLTLFDI